jgi:UDP-glucose 4-epimerase
MTVPDGLLARVRVLVTGAFGFVGTALAERLAAAGHGVRALTSRADGVGSGSGSGSGSADDLEIVCGDVRDPEAMARAVRDVDGVCHLAALVRVREARERASEYWAVNHGGAVTVAKAAAAEAARSGRPVRFVLASTGAVYGQPALQPIPEDLPFQSTNDYGESKRAAELDVLAPADSGSPFGAVALRLFNVAGAVGGRTGDPDTIIPKTLAVARGDLPALQVNGDGEAVRDFVHVCDVAKAFESALGHAVPGRRAVFNVGATGARVLDVVRTVREVTGRDVPVEHRPSRGEAPMLLADTRRIRAELGWRPERSDLRSLVADAWAAMGGRRPEQAQGG